MSTLVASLPADAVQIAQAVRSHWRIEGSCHWVIDFTFNEDQSRIRRGDGAHNFAFLRQFGLNLLKQEKSKASIRRKLFRASLNEDFRFQVLANNG